MSRGRTQRGGMRGADHRRGTGEASGVPLPGEIPALRAGAAYIGEKGLDTIREHARGFIETRLAPAELPNDGRQTPMRGHPVFLAQHACACCCRKCLYKWYKIPPGIQLNRRQQEKIVNLLMAWIQRQL